MVTEGDVIAVTIIGFVTGGLSTCGSVAIIIMLLRSEKKLSSTYRRLLFGMSATDIVFSTSIMLGSTLSPKDTVGLWMPMGNLTTCTLQGLALYSGNIGLTFYNCSLCLYYYLSLAENVQRDRMIKIERFFHAVPIAWILSTSTLLLSTDSFNNFGIVCMISSSPKGCDSNDEVECTRGIHAKFYRMFFHLLPIILIFIIICSSMSRICLSIRAQEQKMETYRANLGTLPDSIRAIRQERNTTTSFDIENMPRPSRRRESVGDRLRRDACKQALCHVFAYFLSYVFSMIFQGIVTFTGEVNVTFWVLQQLTAPTQGFFNFIVFLRPRVIAVRNHNPELSLFAAVRRTIKNNEEIQDVSRPFGGSHRNSALSPRRESRRYTAREWHLKSVTEEKITKGLIDLSIKIDTALN
jgi:hypothetical protein